ncbi:hypothetical protein [Aquibacillus rhizosphaerae]|uniref:Uncharacterized protein n=1 Tax=Aquibacillus rhizosphaerae TaxID=3051431 RepID=A0ABT7LB23_9BACI|nr:hypothetical protein [Aquibacillus sp. LR5S19]MDL4842452.1 hypothetical protein [Aquibacillus sp. LR5S19]
MNGNALGTETSKSIHQSMGQPNTFFPQYIARYYALQTDIEAKSISKIIFVNIQFYHWEYDTFIPTFVGSVITLPESPEQLKGYVENWWLKYTAFEDTTWKDSIKNDGEMHTDIDQEYGITTLFWCEDLVSIDGPDQLLEVEKQLVEVFEEV